MCVNDDHTQIPKSFEKLSQVPRCATRRLQTPYHDECEIKGLGLCKAHHLNRGKKIERGIN